MDKGRRITIVVTLAVVALLVAGSVTWAVNTSTAGSVDQVQNNLVPTMTVEVTVTNEQTGQTFRLGGVESADAPPASIAYRDVSIFTSLAFGVNPLFLPLREIEAGGPHECASGWTYNPRTT